MAGSGKRIPPALTARLSDGVADRVRRTNDHRFTQLVHEVESLRDQVAALQAGTPWELVERKTLTEPVSSVTFTGLDGDADVEYLVRGYIRDAGSAGSADLELRPNGATTTFRRQRLSGSGAAAAASVGTTPSVAVSASALAGVIYLEGILWAKTGGLRVYHGSFFAGESTTPASDVQIRSWHWTNTSSVITHLQFVDAGAANMAAGSELSLYRRARY